MGEWIGWYHGQDPGEPLDWRDNDLYFVHRFGPHPAPDGALSHNRLVDLDRPQWPEPAQVLQAYQANYQK